MTKARRLGPALIYWACITVTLCVLSANLIAAEEGNAALPYYQALVQCPDFYRLPSDVTGSVLAMNDLPEQAKMYVKEHRDVIELVAMAAEGHRCEWGITPHYASGLEHFAQLRTRTILFLFAAHAQIVHSDGDYRAAFARLLTLRRFAGHMATDPNWGFSLPTLVEGEAVELVRRMLERTPLDEDLLAWLHTQLSFEPLPPRWLPSLVRNDLRRFVYRLGTQGALTRVRGITPTTSNDIYRERQQSWKDLSDDELVELVRKPYVEFVRNVIRVLTDEMPYADKRAALDRLVQGITQEAREDPALIWTSEAEHIPATYDAFILYRAMLNAVRGAIEIYSIVAETGTLPQTLPEGFPKDPFSQEVFAYKVTSDGFTLCCRVKPSARKGYFEFRLPGPPRGK